MKQLSISIAATMLAATLAVCSNTAAAQETVLTGKVVTIQETGAKKYIGRITPVEDVDLKARISGILETIQFQEGELVRQGDLLFEIEDTTYQAQLKSAEAKRDQTRAERDYAQKNFKRQQDLSDKKIVSESTLEEAVRLLDYNQARLAETEAALLDARNNLSYTKVYAPITGRIGKSTYTRGNYLTPSSETLAEIVQVAPIYVEFAISEPDFVGMFGNAENLKKTGIVRLRTAERSDYPEVGRIALVDNRVDTDTGTIKVWAIFENRDLKLNPGGLVDALISQKTQQAYPAVRMTAVMIGPTGHYVYTLSSDHKVVPRPVTVGELVGENQIIKSGLQAGEAVIIDGTHKARPGMTVNPVSLEEKTATPAAAPASASSAPADAKTGK